MACDGFLSNQVIYPQAELKHIQEKIAGIVISALLERLLVLPNHDVKLHNSPEFASWAEATRMSRKHMVNVPSTAPDDI